MTVWVSRKVLTLVEVKSLGLSLVRNLIYNQLKGKIDFRRNRGTEIRIDFKVTGKEVNV